MDRNDHERCQNATAKASARHGAAITILVMTKVCGLAITLTIVSGTMIAISGTGRAQAPFAEYDLIIRGGSVLDGTGAEGTRTDLGVSGDRIVTVGRIPPSARARRSIDATNLTVSPGFIDVHSHAAEGLSGALSDAIPLLAQGVTTVFINPDGGGPIDLTAQRKALDARRVGVNIGQFVPQGSIRSEVMGLADRDPTADEATRMTQLVRAGMDAGGLGLSTGLYYAPGSYTKTDEMVTLAKVAAEYGGVYSSHIRDEADYNIGVVAAVDEVIRIAEQAHIRAVVSHMKALGPANWGRSVDLVAAIDRARSRGLQVFADQYAYDASGTSVVAALVPRWAEAGGRRAMLERVNGADAARIRAAIVDNIARRGGPEKMVVSDYAPDHTLEGRSLADVALSRSTDVVDVVVDLLQRGDPGLVSFNMSDEDIVRIMRQSWTMTCSDGELTSPGSGKPHPRGYGAFARKLGLYARERHVIDLAQAVHSMSGLPATVFGLKDRGAIREGAVADVVVFDAARIRDTATYTEPQQLAEGVRYVLVNGVLVFDDAVPTGKRPGQFIRPLRQ
jgi:N-acyl-D-amino-acid deacylase